VVRLLTDPILDGGREPVALLMPCEVIKVFVIGAHESQRELTEGDCEVSLGATVLTPLAGARSQATL
jgi:hypothetical protein